MKLSEAIEILDGHQKESFKTEATDIHFALLLGIEALEQERRLRINNRTYRGHRLPGETPE